MDIYFQHLAPVYRKLGWPVFVLLLPAIIYLFRIKKKKEAIICLLIYAGMILMMGMDKIRDAHDTIFFTGARFYLFFPFLLLFILVPLLKPNSRLSRLINKWSLLIALIVFAVKIAVFAASYSTIEKVGKKHWVAVDEVTAIKDSCIRVKQVGEENGAELVVFEDDHDQLLNYGCPCLEEGFSPTLFPWYERRTWRLAKERNTVRNNILFVRPKTSSPMIDSLHSPARGYHVLENNEVSTIDLLEGVGMTVRPF
jgi:hypothetical protein